MPVPDFSPGEVLTAAAMDSIGLWLVKTQTVGTAVSSVTVTGAFSSTYENYLITYTNGSSSALCDLYLKFGSVATGYYGGVFGASYISGAYAGLGLNNGTVLYAGTANTGFTVLSCEVFSPNISGKKTFVNSKWVYNNGGNAYSSFVGEQIATTAFTAFDIIPAGGATITGGTIRVYGYRN
jgi:hypothetical protein